MPRSFELVAESPATVEQVHSAFRRRHHWTPARLATFTGVTGQWIDEHGGALT